MNKADKYAILDFVRAGAAFLVLLDHLRRYVFPSYAQIVQSGEPFGIVTKTFYMATSFGHQAVVIFFALSGFLVGGKALEDCLQSRFSWSRYTVRRLSRLWIVIPPALVLTLLFDSIGQHFSPQLYAAISSEGHPTDNSLATMFGNIVFLQTILVPYYGSNAPMWSLANEFWYYLAFPLMFWLLFARTSAKGRAIGFSVLVGVVLLLPRSFWLGGEIWLAGAAAAWITHRAREDGILTLAPVRAAAIVFPLVGMLLTRASSQLVGDLTFGFIVAAALPVLALLPSPGKLFSTLSSAGSEVSYTLYLTHFPMLVLLVASGAAPRDLHPGPAAWIAYLALVLFELGWATLMWWVLQRCADRLRRLFVPQPSPWQDRAPRREPVYEETTNMATSQMPELKPH